MDDKAPDLVLGEIAVQRGLISREELAACVEAQKLMTTAKPLGEIMVQMQLVTHQQLASLLSEQQSKIESRRDPPRVLTEMFGRIAVEKGYVGIDQVDECLAEQTANPGLRLGQIMMRRGFLSTDRFLEVLKLQERRVRKCPSCGEETLFSDEQITASELRCPKCNSRIEQGRATTRRNRMAPTSENPTAQMSATETVATETPPDGALPASPIAPTIRLSSPTRFGGSSTTVGTLPLEGRQIGRYKLIETLGRGGMGVVYKALDLPLNRTVALKMLRVADAPDPSTVLRFLREAKTAASLNHPGIVTVFEVGSLEDAHYFTMEYIEGSGLDKALELGKVTREQAIDILENVARAIDYAHSCGVVHRDLKPANVMVDASGQPHITDFGLAKELSPATMVTQEGTAVGTPFYMAPEQARGDLTAIDARSDVYALGVMLYEILTGDVPHTGDTAMEIYQKILNEEPLRPTARKPDVPPGLERICVKAMEKDKSLRYAGAAEFADDLRRFLNGEPVNARPVTLVQSVARRMRRNKTLVGIVLLLLAALVGGGFFFNGWLQEKNRAQAKRAVEERRAAAKVHFDRGVELIDAAEKVQYKKDAKSADLIAKVRAGIEALNQAITTDDTYAEAFHRRGRARMLVGEWAAAEADLSAALGLDPARVAARYDLGRLHLRQYELLRGRPVCIAGPFGEILGLQESDTPLATAMKDRAIEEFRLVVEKVQTTEEVALARAVVAWADSRWEDALNRAMEVQRQSATPEIAYHLRALIYASSKRPREAMREFDQTFQQRSALREPAPCVGLTPYTRAELDWAVAAYSIAIDKTATPELLVARGTILHAMKDFAKARADYDRAIRDKATNVEALARRALLSMVENKLTEAMTDAKAIVTGAPEDPRGRMLRALVRLEKEEELDGAQADADEAARRLPDDAMALTIRARARVGTDPDGAYRDASQALGIIKELYPAYEARALARCLTRDYLGASDDIKRCLEFKPDYWRAYWTSSMVRASKNDAEGAINDLTQALQIKKDHLVMLLRRAELRLARGLYADAMADYDRFVELRPGDGRGPAGRAICLILTGKREDGFAILDQLIAQVPAFGYATRGKAFYFLQDYRQAIDDFETAIRTDAAIRNLVQAMLQDARRRVETGGNEPKDWRGYLRRANQNISNNNYPAAQRDFLIGFKMMPAAEYTDQELRDLSVSAYNLSCTFAVDARKLKDEAKAEAMEQCFKWLEKAAVWGFFSIDANPCPKNPKAHTGREHTSHDEDFDVVKAEARFKKILEYKEEL